MLLNGLYAITDENLTPNKTMLDQIEKAINGGAKIIQFRYKSNIDNEVIKQAFRLKKLCRSYNIPLIINDHLDLTKEIDADGIHVGIEDFNDIVEIKKEIPGKMIGVSCYNDIHLALKAYENGADYVAFGAFFSSSIKPHAKKADINILKEAKSKIDIPICAIGGINSKNYKKLIESGADMCAVISDLWNSPDIEKKASEYRF